ncbi:glycosyltransferase family 4 protein [Candidatus Roizmanbacteria bacterium]|nr:glycosyltransferase family 4 protein [Candidatus Roizmanbacteria bacterium]
MKIGIVSPYLNTLGGGERYMLEIASHLSTVHNVSLFWDEKDIKEKAQQILSINIHRVTLVPNIFSRTHSLYKKISISRKYDLLIFLSDGSIPLSLARYNLLHFQQPFRGIGGTSVLNVVKLSRYQRIVCNSEFTKRFIDQEFTCSSDVLYPPVSVEKFHEGNKQQVILSVGRFHPFKKHHEMIRIFNKASKQLNGWQLHLAGGLLKQDDNYFSELQHLTRSSSVRLLPNISFSTLQKEYASAMFYWHAAGFGEGENEHPERMEHFGIAPVEAMAAGCIPLLFNGGGLREIIQSGKQGYLWNDEDECLEQMMQLIANKNLRETIKASAIEKSKQFAQQEFYTKLDHIIQQIISGKVHR